MVLTASASNYETIVYDQKSGLQQSYIYTLLQDEYNYLWIGTQEGLMSYDGISFKKYTKKDGLIDNLIISGFKDSKGKLYFGHFNGSLSTYHNNQFDSIKLSQELLQPIAFLEHKNIIYVLTRNNGIYAIDNQSVIQYGAEELNGKVATNLALLNHEIVISHNQGLHIFNPESQKVKEITLPYKNLGSQLVKGQKFDSGCWLWTEQKGLMAIKKDLEINTIISADKIPFQPEFIYEDDYQNLWLGSKVGGIIKLSKDLITKNYRIKNILNKQEISSNKISCLTQDHEGNYWAGSLGNGLIYLKKLKIKNYLAPENGDFNAIIPDGSNFVIGTNKGAFFASFDPGSNEWQMKATNWLPKGVAVTALFKNKDEILVGTATRGVYTVNQKGEVRAVTYNHELKKGAVRRIFKRDSIMYVAVSGNGFYKVGATIKQFSTATGFIHNEIYDLHLDHQERLWVAMHANGLSVRANNAFQHLTIKNQIDARDINAITQDKNNNLWIATDGYGLYKYDPEFNLLSHFKEENIGSNFGFFLVTKNKYVYVGTENGINKINISNDSIETTPLDDFTGNLMPILNGCAINNDGDMMILTPNGYLVVNHTLEKQFAVTQKLLLTNFKVFNQETTLSNKLLKGTTINISEFMELKPSENNLNFEFLNISFEAPENTLYSFQLNDEHGEWSQASSYNQITYPSLNAGRYTLKVKSKIASSQQSQFLTISFEVPQPFYRQLWFLALCSFFFLGFTFTFYTVKNRNIRLQNKRLEQLVSERTLELKEINDELLTTQEDVQHKNEQLLSLNNSLEAQVRERTQKLKEALSEYDTFLYQASHSLKGPLARLKGLTSLMKLDTPHVSKVNIDLFDLEYNRLQNILNKLTIVHSIFKSEAVKEEISLLSIIEDHFKRSDTLITPIIDSNFNDRILVNPEIINIILENLLENAIMFQRPQTSKHEIRISSYEKGDFHVIEIYDNGTGIEQNIIPHIFKMYYRGNAGSKGNGLGLYLVKKGLEKINASIEVESEVMKYSIFKLSIPV